MSLSSFLTASESPLQSLVSSHTQFAFSLYKTSLQEDPSPLFSPYSIATCLSILYLGAKGETQSQLAQALFLQENPDALGSISALLTASLPPLNNHSALFISQETPILSDFRKTVQTQFNTSLIPTNFKNPKQAVSRINRWISNVTMQKIPSLLTEQEISVETRLVLLNALYFEGTFQHPFSSQHTTEGVFFPSLETQTQIPFMEQTATIPYYENEIAQIGALLFVNSSLMLLFVLPKSSENNDLVFKELQGQFGSWISSLKQENIHLKLPKWHHTQKLNLKPLLQQMGVTEAFIQSADFSGIDGALDLVLGQVLHQVDFTVSEQGITAAAATGAVLNLKLSAVITPAPSIPFYLNHPFFYFLVDNNTHEILFMGHFAK